MSLKNSDINEAIPVLLERHVQRRPDHIAFVHEGTRSSYGELGRRINAVAATVATHEPERDSPVLVFMKPGISSVAAFIGTLRAGAICALVDISNPRGRLETILDNLRPGLCIADQDSVASRLPHAGHGLRIVLHIAIAEHRDSDFFFNRCYYFPVRFT